MERSMSSDGGLTHSPSKKELDKLEKEKKEKEEKEAKRQEREAKRLEKEAKRIEKERKELEKWEKEERRKRKRKVNQTVSALPPGVLPGLPVPISVLSDSYKATHFFQYPDARKMVAYGEFRRAFQKDEVDQRIVCFGMRYIIQTFVARPWTLMDVDSLDSFFKTHNAGFTAFPFPRDIFVKFIRENNGYFPVKIETPPEGSVIYPHIPVYQITATEEYSRLVTFLETLLTMIWYPCTVATLSRRVHTRIKAAFEESVDEENYGLLSSRLQDFGFRGCTCVEQSVIGGVSHLLNFEGSDTMSAAYYAQFHLNQGRPVATSIPATEHSVMTSYLNERQAMEHMIKNFGTGVFAVVMDSYDYTAALEKVLPSVAKHKTEKGGYLVLRPDSGDPVEVVMQALRQAEKVFGCDINKKGYKVLKGVGVIQGDGIDHKIIGDILTKAHEEKYSAQNIAFGMGAGLLQKVNRDTMSFATKLGYIVYKDGTARNVMKAPKTDPTKFSLPGQLMVIRNADGLPVLYPDTSEKGNKDPKSFLKVVYDHGPVNEEWDDFDTVRKRLNEEWAKYPLTFDVISQEMRDLIVKTREEQLTRNAESTAAFEVESESEN